MLKFQQEMKRGKTFTNLDLAKLLRNVSAAYEIKNKETNRFRIIAYDRAATAIENATSEVKDLWEDNKLSSIPGVGVNISQHLDELFSTGKVKHFQEVMSRLPPAMFQLMQLKGVGPKTAFKLCQGLGIKRKNTALEKLKEKAENGQVSKLPNFGKDSEEAILKSISQYQSSGKKKKRMLLAYAEELAKEILDYLQTSPEVERADSLGSLRRKTSTIGDIDFAVATVKPAKVISHFLNFSKVKRVLEKGKKKASVILNSGHQVDLVTHHPKAYGSLLQHFTGSKHHNIQLRELANKKGLSLSEYGITKLNQKAEKRKIIKFKTEEEFYKYLGLDWIPPELRENTGEIEAAQKHQLPSLIKNNQVKGDLHLHSNFQIETSHDTGEDSMSEIVKQSVKLGYQYLAFTEHNPSKSKHNPKEIISILKAKKDFVDKKKFTWIKNFNIRVFNGLEIDIRPDGTLAIPDESFEYLDFAIVSIHSSFDLSREKMTARIIRGLNHPKVKILAHPTGRLLGSRESYQVNWSEVFDFCQKNDKALEINAYPKRLDLPDVLVRAAVKKKVKLVINSDSHAKRHLGFIKYGVSVARRGWAESKDIINSWPLDKICRFLEVSTLPS